MSVDSMRKAVSQEKRARIATIVIWIGALGMFPIMAIGQWLPEMELQRAGLLVEVLMTIVGATFLGCQVLAIPALAWYVIRYRHALDRARGEAHDAGLAQLQEAVAGLAARVVDEER